MVREHCLHGLGTKIPWKNSPGQTIIPGILVPRMEFRSAHIVTMVCAAAKWCSVVVYSSIEGVSFIEGGVIIYIVHTLWIGSLTHV